MKVFISILVVISASLAFANEDSNGSDQPGSVFKTETEVWASAYEFYCYRETGGYFTKSDGDVLDYGSVRLPGVQKGHLQWTFQVGAEQVQVLSEKNNILSCGRSGFATYLGKTFRCSIKRCDFGGIDDTDR